MPSLFSPGGLNVTKTDTKGNLIYVTGLLPDGGRPQGGPARLDRLTTMSQGTVSKESPPYYARFEDLSAALRAQAEGVYCVMAAVELLIGHRF